MTFTYPSHTTKGCVPLSSDVKEREKYTMLKSIITLIVTLIVGVVFMAIGNDFLNGSTDLGVIVAVAVAGALVVFFNGQKGK